MGFLSVYQLCGDNFDPGLHFDLFGSFSVPYLHGGDHGGDNDTPLGNISFRGILALFALWLYFEKVTRKFWSTSLTLLRCIDRRIHSKLAESSDQIYQTLH